MLKTVGTRTGATAELPVDAESATLFVNSADNAFLYIKHSDGTAKPIANAGNDRNDGNLAIMRNKGLKTGVSSALGTDFLEVNVTAGVVCQAYRYDGVGTLRVVDYSTATDIPAGSVSLPAAPSTGNSQLHCVVWNVDTKELEVLSGAEYTTGNDPEYPEAGIEHYLIDAYIIPDTATVNGDITKVTYSAAVPITLCAELAKQSNVSRRVGVALVNVATQTFRQTTVLYGSTLSVTTEFAASKSVRFFTIDQDDLLRTLELENEAVFDYVGLTYVDGAESAVLDHTGLEVSDNTTNVKITHDEIMLYGADSARGLFQPEKITPDISGVTTYAATSAFENKVPTEIQLQSSNTTETLTTLTGGYADMEGCEIDITAKPGLTLTVTATAFASLVNGSFYLKDQTNAVLDGSFYDYLRVRFALVDGKRVWQEIARGNFAP